MWNPLYLSADLTLLRRMSNRKMRYLDKFSSIQAVYRLGYIKSFPTWGTWGWSQKIICLPRRCHRIVAQIISKRSFMSISLAVLPSAPYFKIARMKDGGELNVVFMVGDLAITGDAHSQSLVVSIFPPRELRCVSRHLPIYQMSPWTQKGQIRVRHEYFSLIQTFMLVMFYRTSVGKEHICAEHTNAAQLNCYKLVVDPPSTRLFRREALVLHGSAIDGSDDKVLENFCLPVFWHFCQSHRHARRISPTMRIPCISSKQYWDTQSRSSSWW